MAYYILDSNIWIDLSHGKIRCEDIVGRSGIRVVLAPFAITELMRGIVKGGQTYFSQNRKMVRCMAHCDVLELPKVFIYKTLWNVDGGISKVHSSDYKALMEMLVGSGTYREFLQKTEAPGSAWRRMSELD